jgi:hypothetical protein
MHSAIVVIEIPETPYNATSNQAWQMFLATIDRLQARTSDPLDKQEGVERLGENVWLVNFLQNPAALARLVETAARAERPYKILQLDAAPQWLPVGSDPKPS